MSTNRTAPVGLVAREALARRETGMRFSDARDDLLLIAAESLELGLLFHEVDEEFTDECGDGALLLGSADARAMVEVGVHGNSDIFYSFAVSVIHSPSSLGAPTDGSKTLPDRARGAISYCRLSTIACGLEWLDQTATTCGITCDLTDEELALGDLAALTRDFDQRYRTALSGYEKKPRPILRPNFFCVLSFEKGVITRREGLHRLIQIVRRYALSALSNFSLK